MRRFFFDASQRQGENVTLSSEESRHISRVLRLHRGEVVEICDRQGNVYVAEIVENAEKVIVKIVSQRESEGGENCKVLVGLGAIKSKKMELVLQKCTELGVNGFYPFVSNRCQRNLIQQYRGKGDRWHRIIDEACKQCLRLSPMELNDIRRFEDILDHWKDKENTLKVVFWEKEKNRGIHDIHMELSSASSVILLFGPEGGFTEVEIREAISNGWQTVGLGDRILRAETAVIAAVSIVQHSLGQM